MNTNIMLTRVTDTMRFGMNQRNLMDILGDVGKAELELTTGRRVNVPSDDPLAATRILNLQKSLSRIEQYQSNVTIAKSRLSHLETVLADMNDLGNRAREILMSQVGSNGNEQTRANAAVEVANLVEAALNLANRTFEGRYIFGGADTDVPPFDDAGLYVAFRGTTDEWMVPVGADSLFATSLNPEDVLGARSAEIKGRNDLVPALQLQTKLSDLNGGEGVRLGGLTISNGMETATVDLSGAVDIEDVIDRINESGVVTASLRADRMGLSLEKIGGDITVLELDEGHTAGDLGLLAADSGASVQGGSLDVVITAATKIADLRGGAGLDLTGLKVTNGNVEQTIDFAGIETVNDLLDRVKKSGAYLDAEINTSRTGINIVSILNGAEFTIEEAGGSTAAQMGLEIDLVEQSLEQLNRGFGVACNFGLDFEISLHDGSSFSVDISNCETLADVVETINQAEGNGGKLTAGYGAGDNLQLVDNTSGSERLSVTPVKGSAAARYLGIEKSTTDASLEGDDLNPAGERVDGLFNSLIALREALAENDEDALLFIEGHLDQAQDKLLDARADVGGRINRLELSENRFAEQKINLEEVLGEERDVDFAEATIEYQKQQTRLEAALRVMGMITSQSLLDYL